jgi:transposase-like protein
LTITQKAKIALAAVKEQKTINEIAQDFGVHLIQISLWKKSLIEKLVVKESKCP